MRLNKIVPYLILFVSCLLICYLLFYIGFPEGDDTVYHMANIYDTYLSLKEGTSLRISRNLINGLGYGKGLFYSPLSHLSVALLGIILERFNISLMQSFKIVIFLSIFISGIFTYIFVQKISKRKYVALICAIVYMAMPYRLFCFYARNAFAEGFAICFIPLFFMGLYDYLEIKDDNFNAKPFFEIILGASLLYLSHNITALFSYVLGVIYIIIFSKRIGLNLKNKRYLTYTCVSAMIIFFLCSLILLPCIEQLNTSIYNVSNPSRMNTTYEYVVKQIDRNSTYTGFINYSYLFSSYKEIYNVKKAISEIVIYYVIVLLVLVCDYLFNYIKILRKFKNFIIVLLTIILSLILYKTNVIRVEHLISISLLLTCYLSFNIFKQKNFDLTCKFNLHVVSYLVLLFVILLLLFSKKMWAILPSQFYVIQFSWRLNGLLQFIFVILLAFALSKMHNKSILVVSSICMVIPLITQGNIEKRLNYEVYDKANFVTCIDDSYFDYRGQIGHNREYLPYIYYYNEEENYIPKFKNSLYYTVIKQINNPKEKLDLTCAVLEGKASVSNFNMETPKLEFDIAVDSDNAIVQLPLLYYKGYEIVCISEEGTQKLQILDPKDTDYLVSFEINQGSYKIYTTYSGTKVSTISKNLFVVGLLFSSLFILYDISYIDLKKFKNSTLNLTNSLK